MYQQLVVNDPAKVDKYFDCVTIMSLARQRFRVLKNVK